MEPWNRLFKTIIIFFFISTINSSSQSIEPYGSNIVGVKTQSGLHTASFKLNNGQLRVNMPADMAINDFVSGSVNFEFYELETGELVTKNFNISDYTLVIEGKIIDLSGENFKFKVPYNLPAGVVNVALEEKKGKVIGRAFFPVRLTEAERFGTKGSTDSDFRLPSTGRAGKPVAISGHFDGDYETTNLSISGRMVKIMAESPRKLIFESPTGITGSRVIGLKEGDVNIKNPYMNLDVVRVSEDQSYFVSSIQQNSILAEKGKRGEFIIETDDVDETISNWRRPSSEIVDKYGGQELSEEVISEDKGLKIEERPERQIVEERTREEVAEDTSQETVISENEVLDMQIGSGPVTGENLTKPENADEVSEAAGVDSSNYEITDTKELEIVRDHLARQYEAELSEQSADAAENTQGSGIQDEKKINEIEQEIRIEKEPVKESLIEEADIEKEPDTIQQKNGTGYALQLASLKHKKDADKIIEKLNVKGYNAYSVKVNIPGKGTWHRVKIGGFESRKQAENFKSSIDLSGVNINSGTIFVTEEDNQ